MTQLVKCDKSPFTYLVISGLTRNPVFMRSWIPACAGMTVKECKEALDALHQRSPARASGRKILKFAVMSELSDLPALGSSGFLGRIAHRDEGDQFIVLLYPKDLLCLVVI